MKARDIMVMNVITVGPEASVRQVADILFKNRISALPVVDEHGELIGIVSEGDLARRAELETDYRRSWWLETFARKSKETLAVEYVKSHARRVKDVMTRRVITATPATSLRDIAALLEKNRIKRVPIVAKGRVVGIVSRANLIQALASLSEESKQSTASEFDDPEEGHGAVQIGAMEQALPFERDGAGWHGQIVGHCRLRGGEGGRASGRGTGLRCQGGRKQRDDRAASRRRSLGRVLINRDARSSRV